jgi:hypothetical protein
MNVLWQADRAFLALTLAYAGIAKARDQQGFANSLRAFSARSRVSPRLLARLVIVIELALAVLLFLGVAILVVASVSAALMAAMTGVLVHLRISAPGTPCSCFGRSAHPVDLGAIGRDAFLLAIAACLAVADGLGGVGRAGVPVASFSPPGRAVVFFGLLVLAGLLCATLGALDSLGSSGFSFRVSRGHLVAR